MSDSTGPPPLIYVACHQADGPHPNHSVGYRAVCNTAPDGTRPAGYEHYDSMGYPGLNQSYCEMSVLRDLYARVGSEIAEDTVVGLVHYRRIFVSRLPRAPRYYDDVAFLTHFDWAHPEAFHASATELARAAVRYDWVAAPVYDVRLFGLPSTREHLLSYEKPEIDAAVDIADTAIAELRPGAQSLSSYLAGTPLIRPFNMFIARGTTLRTYGEFIWPVLERITVGIGTPADPVARRYAGYLAEHLYNYWLDTIAVPGGMRLGQLPVACLNRGVLINSDTGATIDPRDTVMRLRGAAPLVDLNNFVVRRRQLAKRRALTVENHGAGSATR